MASSASSESPPPCCVHPIDPQTLFDRRNMRECENHQYEVMSKKLQKVQNEMLRPDNLVHLYKCSSKYCTFSTDDRERARSHWNEHIALSVNCTFRCPYCQSYSPSRFVDELIHHMTISHGHMSFCCSRCIYRAATGHSVESHIKRVHGVWPKNGSILQAIEHRIYMSDDTNYTAENLVQNYICPHWRKSSCSLIHCGFETPFLYEMVNHLEGSHDYQTHHCSYCAIPPLDTAADWIKHMKIHGFDTLVCGYCGIGRANKTKMLNHFSCIHPEKMLRVFSRQTSPISLVAITANPLGTVNVVIRDNMDADNKDPIMTAHHARGVEQFCLDLQARGQRCRLGGVPAASEFAQ